ncbi:hypothetical protein [Bathymodiolus thermophilus thioautotrophic gill symbiont]|uniref:Lipoprotein n=1 Tax=Bathymodiolus thermophilus thioautotrophic gill symbiont TaxID=2360 RepID=A0A1J5U538_9GAMM|nr:hypothetical protein [Bathymodiolus thermophilus thioautotrophic gill symbiont]OIR23926.1 hypothetical protein BGC33_08660 [Bathymodiolus thermophilus thioautotrophic gill symbiont]CAB5502985.1 hypothetical protein THERMOS_1705 [Bathymodiolus thermophilus thioautotrophic gill symbiont]
MFKTTSKAFITSLLLSSCTYYTNPPAPLHEITNTDNGITIVNTQFNEKPKIYSSDGITTHTTNYKAWTDIVINKVRNILPKTTQVKVLKIGIRSIVCSGSFVADCIIITEIEIGSGYKNLITTERRHGHYIGGGNSALTKAIDESAQQIATNQAVLKYLFNK